ncbi:hypothetical protein ACFWXO_27835, partial [Kitasatospora sp. NPDC059088]
MRGSPLHQHPTADPAALPWAAPVPAAAPPPQAYRPGPVAPQPGLPQSATQGPAVPGGGAAAGPTAVPAQLPSLDVRGSATRPAVDTQVARELKRQVAAELHQQITRLTTTSGAEPDRATRRQRGRALIEEAVARWSDAYAQTHGIPPTREQDRALAEAVFDLLFRAGRLQPYLDDPEIENILVNGCDDVWVSKVHQPLRQVPPVADSDAELVELLQDLARQHGGGERSLSTASPTLALGGGGGGRAAARARGWAPPP